MRELKVDYFFNCYNLVVNVFPDFLYGVGVKRMAQRRRAKSSWSRFFF